MTTTVARRSGSVRPRAGVVASAFTGPVTTLRGCASAGGQAHEVGVEVDVFGAVSGAGGVATELVWVATPVAVGDLSAGSAAQHDGELLCGAGGAPAEVGRAPVLRCGVEGGRHRDRPEEREQWPELPVDDHGVSCASACRREDDGFCDEQVVVDQVGERLEQAADPRLVD